MTSLFGTRYAGFYYPKDLPGLHKDSIVYCVGAGEDISHDIALAHKLGSPVYIFDPTPRSITHIQLVKDVMDGKQKAISNKRYGGGDLTYWSYIMDHSIESSNLKAYPWGIYTKTDTNLRFYTPTNTEYVSCSLVEGMKSQDYIEVGVKTLKDTMIELGHTTIDLLKLDIEGCECDVLDQMLADQIKPKYISIDFDLGWTGEKIRDRPRCELTIHKLSEAGYKLIYESGPEWSFQLKDI
jgi:FkbM family methyltransferase